MHNLPLTLKIGQNGHAHWLTEFIHLSPSSFVTYLSSQPSPPSLGFAHIHTNKGGLGFLFPNHRAVLDFIITTTNPQ